MLPWMHHQQRTNEFNWTCCTHVVDHSPSWFWSTHQSHSHWHAAMDAPSTENQGIQPYPLYECGWSFQDYVEVHTKAKAFNTLPWMHHQQRTNEFNWTCCTRVVDHSPRWCWGTHQSHSLQHTTMDAPSTENQGIQPDPLYACGWSLQDVVEVHTKAKAFDTLPWMHHQQRIKEFNRTHCTRVVDHSPRLSWGPHQS